MKILYLAMRLLKRDWRAGELGILLFALIIAAASVTSIHLFTQRVDLAMQDQAGDFLGADLLLSSPRALKAGILEQATLNRLATSQSILFSSVIVAKDRFQLAELKAVDAHYPLRNQLRIASDKLAEELAIVGGPPLGEVWMEPRLFSILGIEVGEQVEVGEISLRATALLKQDPGQSNSFFSIAPRLLMNLHDMERSKLIQPGSRVTYQLLFAGALSDRIAFERWLRPSVDATQRLLGGKEGTPALNSAMDRAEKYFSLSTVFSILLAGIAVAMAAHRYGERHFDQTALMACMGATQQQLLTLYALQLLLLGSMASLLGCALGYAAQVGLVQILGEFLPAKLPAANVMPYLTGFSTGMFTLVGFSLPMLLRLKSIPPLRVLRRDLSPLPASAISVYGMALASLMLMMWWQSGAFLLTLLVLAGVLAMLVFLLLISQLLFGMSRSLVSRLHGPFRFGVQQLLRFRRHNQMQMLAFGLAMVVLLAVTLVRTELLDQWRAQLPDKTPNYFVVNIQPDELLGVQTFFQQHQLITEGLYPMVRGRLHKINGKLVEKSLSEASRNDEALKRELNLSWVTKMQANNHLVEGQWWTSGDVGQRLISIEERLAKRLSIVIGDRLGFQVGDREVEGEVRSIRAVAWDSFQPNFYILFAPESLQDLPTSYISSFYLAADNKMFLHALVQQYPSLTLIEIDGVLKQVQAILSQVTYAVEYLQLFVLLSALMVLLASIQASMDQRIQAAVVMRALGAQNAYLQKSQATEFVLLGLFTGLLAAFGTETIAFGLYRFVFDLDYQLHLWIWLVAPLISVLLIGLAGLRSVLKIQSS